MKTVTVKLSEPLATWLSQRARELGRSQSDVIRDALQQASHGGSAPSCHDLLAYMCGKVDGPEDLATNPKYMAGYGK